MTGHDSKFDQHMLKRETGHATADGHIRYMLLSYLTHLPEVTKQASRDTSQYATGPLPTASLHVPAAGQGKACGAAALTVFFWAFQI